MPIDVAMNPAELKERTKQFALRILKVVEAMPRSVSGKILANQMGRSGTAVAANYRAACKARSRAEFVAKLGIVEEEADETIFWLELAAERGSLPGSRLAPLIQEAGELTAIFAASRKTARLQTNRPSAIENRQCQ